MSGRLDGKVIVIVGGTAGLGLAAGRSRLDDPAELVMQMAAARRGGADGFAIFQLGTDLLTKHAPLLERGPGREGALTGPLGGPLVRWALPKGMAPGTIPAGAALKLKPFQWPSKGVWQSHPDLTVDSNDKRAQSPVALELLRLKRHQGYHGRVQTPFEAKGL